MRRTLISLSILVSASATSLAFGPIGPFAGSMSEGFESFNNYQNGGIFASGPLFGGFANFASSTK